MPKEKFMAFGERTLGKIGEVVEQQIAAWKSQYRTDGAMRALDPDEQLEVNLQILERRPKPKS